MTQLTPDTFDALTRMPVREGRVIWTLKAIGQCVGRGEDFARSLADKPGSPIHRQGRQFYADEAELLKFMGLTRPHRA